MGRGGSCGCARVSPLYPVMCSDTSMQRRTWIHKCVCAWACSVHACADMHRGMRMHMFACTCMHMCIFVHKRTCTACMDMCAGCRSQLASWRAPPGAGAACRSEHSARSSLLRACRTEHAARRMLLRACCSEHATRCTPLRARLLVHAPTRLCSMACIGMHQHAST